MKKKFIVIGGIVESKNDGDLHRISPGRLCFLYNVNPRECYLLSEYDEIKMRTLPKDLPVLRPRRDGNYKLPS